MAVLSKSIGTVSASAFLLLAMLSPRSQRLRFYLNSLLYITTLGICSAWGVVVSILMTLIPGQRLNINKVVARSFYYLTSPLLGIKMHVEGYENFDQARPAVLVGNHQTSLDILYLGKIFPNHAAIMAKRELQFVPLLGQFMTASGAVFINRKNLKDSIKAFEKVGQTMRRKKLSLWIFPEGTRSGLATPDLLPFKKGAFHLAIQAGVPIVPVVCENYNRLFDSRSRFESGEIMIKVLPPVPTANLTAADASDLSNRVREMMLHELKQMDIKRQQQDLVQSSQSSNSQNQNQMGGLAGFFANFIGTGNSFRSINRNVDKQEKHLRKEGTSGQKADDYGLVSEGDKNK